MTPQETARLREAVQAFLAVHDARWPHILGALLITAVRSGGGGTDPCPDQPDYYAAIESLRAAALAADTVERPDVLCGVCERPLGAAVGECPHCHTKFAAPAPQPKGDQQ